MLTDGFRIFRLAVCAAVTLWIGAAPACNVPVFRYALERWEADPYEIVVFHSAPLTAEQQALLETLEKTGQNRLANLTVSRVDLAGEVSPPLRRLWSAQVNPRPPWMVVRYPRQTSIEPSAGAGPLSAETVSSLLESPGRRDIAQKLVSGDAVVWLLLGSADSGDGDEAGRRVEAELRRLEQSLVLPERSPLDPPINPNLPLKIAFSIVRVARSDPAERVLVNMLLNWNTNLTTNTEPMLFPIFGRGRVVPPAIGGEIRAERIREMAEFLTGPCSCEVKEINPGYDLLLTANWSSLSGYQEVMLPDPPPLIGMSQFAAAAQTNPTAPSRQPALAPALSSAAPVEHHPLLRNLVVVLGIAFGLLAATTLMLKVKASRSMNGGRIRRENQAP